MSIKTTSAITRIPKGSIDSIIACKPKGVKLRPIKDPHKVIDTLQGNRLHYRTDMLRKYISVRDMAGTTTQDEAYLLFDQIYSDREWTFPDEKSSRNATIHI